MPRNILILILIISICGCASAKKSIVSQSLDEAVVVTGSVVNPDASEKGGALALGSFKPGPGAAANDETDQLSWMMVKGIKETLPEDNTHFAIQTENADNSDFLLDGYIEEYDRKGHFAHLSVDGEIWLRSTGEKIFLFQTSTRIDLKKQSPKTVAYQIGVAIAHYIGSHV